MIFPFAYAVLFDFLLNPKTPICLSRFPIQPVHSLSKISMAPICNDMTECELDTTLRVVGAAVKEAGGG